LLLIMLE